MAISLQKGQRVSLSKESKEGLDRVIVGLGWDEARQPQTKGFLASLFGGGEPQAIDCDASALLLQGGKLRNWKDVVYFGALRHGSGAVQHMGDNLTGAGEGDDEQIVIELDKVPAQYDRIVVVVNIFRAEARHQHFGMIENAFIRIV
ncbi:MAG: TerD family protein, partial [Evtepia sp.]